MSVQEWMGELYPLRVASGVRDRNSGKNPRRRLREATPRGARPDFGSQVGWPSTGGQQDNSLTSARVVAAILSAIAGMALIWAVQHAPHGLYGLVALLGVGIALDLLASDVLSSGRRIVGPGIVLVVAAFVLYGTPAAVLLGFARGVIRALMPRAHTLNDASSTVAVATIGPLLAGLCATTLASSGSSPALAATLYMLCAYIIEVRLASLLLARIFRPSMRSAARQNFVWTMVH
ncbi:MAG: hypothetical protein M3007_03120, partial [Candidatus Eremiobacteraeota bacterium]|nr:hypothetical protein [Candidatus Eremiobacteraeota bacterium]